VAIPDLSADSRLDYERAEELIRVAAPGFRDEVRAAARKLFYAQEAA
jgi:acyl-CoA hydrolase